MVTVLGNSIVKIFLLTSFALLSGCDITGGCENTILQQETSPDGKNRVTVFQRGCGATVSDSMHVFLGGGSESPGETGNALIGTYWNVVNARWVSNTEISITTDANIFKRVESVNSIKINIVKP